MTRPKGDLTPKQVQEQLDQYDPRVKNKLHATQRKDLREAWQWGFKAGETLDIALSHLKARAIIDTAHVSALIRQAQSELSDCRRLIDRIEQGR